MIRIVLALILAIPGFASAYETCPPKFPWGFVITDHIRDFNLSNLNVITNTPRHFILSDGATFYDWKCETSYSVVLLVNGRPEFLYSIIKTPYMGWRYDRMKVVKKYKPDGR